MTLGLGDLDGTPTRTPSAKATAGQAGEVFAFGLSNRPGADVYQTDMILTPSDGAGPPTARSTTSATPTWRMVSTFGRSRHQPGITVFFVADSSTSGMT